MLNTPSATNNILTALMNNAATALPTNCNSVNPIASAGGGVGGGGRRNAAWLQLEICREFVRSRCSRNSEECKFAHPPQHVEVNDGKVVCCYDFIKNKCNRVEPPCKYLHPPEHLQKQLIEKGRQNLLIKNVADQNMQAQYIQYLQNMQAPMLQQNFIPPNINVLLSHLQQQQPHSAHQLLQPNAVNIPNNMFLTQNFPFVPIHLAPPNTSTPAVITSNTPVDVGDSFLDKSNPDATDEQSFQNCLITCNNANNNSECDAFSNVNFILTQHPPPPPAVLSAAAALQRHNEFAPLYMELFFLTCLYQQQTNSLANFQKVNYNVSQFAKKPMFVNNNNNAAATNVILNSTHPAFIQPVSNVVYTNNNSVGNIGQGRTTTLPFTLSNLNHQQQQPPF